MQTELEYGLFMLLGSRENLRVMVSRDFNEVKSLYEEIIRNLNEARKENSLFIINKPIIEAFDPAFVLRVSLMAQEVPKLDTSNPYVRNMADKGLTSALKENTSGWKAIPQDLQDLGYK